MRHINEPSIYQIIYRGFEELFDNCILKYKKSKELPIGFVGSISFHFREVLHKVAENKGLKIAIIDPNPSEALAKYHMDKEFANA